MIATFLIVELIFSAQHTTPYHHIIQLFNPKNINLDQPIADRFYLWGEKSEIEGLPLQINPNNKNIMDERPSIPFIRFKTTNNSGAGIVIDPKYLEMDNFLHFCVWSDSNFLLYFNLEEDGINQNVVSEEWQYPCNVKANQWDCL